MAERKISVVIDLDDREATSKMQAFDKSVAGATTTVKTADTAVSHYDQTVASIVKSKQAASTAVDQYANKLQQSVTRLGALTAASKMADAEVRALTKQYQEFQGVSAVQDAIATQLGWATKNAAELKTELAKAKGEVLGTHTPTADLTDKLSGSNLTAQKLGATLRSLAGALGLTLGIAGLVKFGKALLDDADALVKLHDKTGLSIEGLQRLQRVGDDAGNITIVEVVGSSFSFGDAPRDNAGSVAAGVFVPGIVPRSITNEPLTFWEA